ncbi:MAG: YqzL family protein [Candidatus Cellulosilyticum pullistercoris]|uniref:YqzL family protein n=1 Tax=Candidatus Cellulosilyticum pullistercoris TaxID=2838521 RepID=A0A9E2NJZ1_9FIRM|nr:YqzL family protein [Candidatus Cellulosilyticum pullistercoris]
MLQEFWSYFMITGQVDTYLNYKAYEEVTKNSSDFQKLPNGENEVG